MSDTETDFVVDHTWREPSGFLPRLAEPTAEEAAADDAVLEVV